MKPISEILSKLVDQHDGGDLRRAADRTGVAHEFLYEIVMGAVAQPDPTMVDKIANSYGITSQELVEHPPAKVIRNEDGETQAEVIIRVISADDLTDVLGNPISRKDRVQGAYAMAEREGLPPGEMAKLDRWREAYLQE